MSHELHLQDRFLSDHQNLLNGMRSDLHLSDIADFSLLNNMDQYHQSLQQDHHPASYNNVFSANDQILQQSDILSSKLNELDQGLSFHDQTRFNGRNRRSNTYSACDLSISPDSLASYTNSTIASPAAWKPCLYYARGFCKHGNKCKFLHTNVNHMVMSPTVADSGFLSSPSNGVQFNDSGSDDGTMQISAGSLERLEYEIQELLRGRKAPISIASLPQLYYERFGKTLQADGYLTESQRHGKAGYSLTKLLARLKNSVTLIDR